MSEPLRHLVAFAAACAYVVGLIVFARWIGGWQGVLLAAAVPPAGALVLGGVNAEIRPAGKEPRGGD